MTHSRKVISLQKAFACGCPENCMAIVSVSATSAVHIAVQSFFLVIRFRAVQRFVVPRFVVSMRHILKSRCRLKIVNLQIMTKPEDRIMTS